MSPKVHNIYTISESVGSKDDLYLALSEYEEDYELEIEDSVEVYLNQLRVGKKHLQEITNIYNTFLRKVDLDDTPK